MAEINDLNVTDASNTARFPEGMSPPDINDGARALEGIIARWNKDTDGSVASTGSANAYVFAANQTLSAYYDGLTITFDANFTNTAAPTLNVDSVSADSIVWPDGGTLTGGEIVSGAKVTVRHDGTNWQLVAGGTPSVLQTEVATTSGTEHDFTGIGSHAKKITIEFEAVSTNGTSVVLVQLGDSGGFETTGYVGVVGEGANASNSNLSGGFLITHTQAASNSWHGTLVLTLKDATNNTWTASGNFADTDASQLMQVAGNKSLSAVLTQTRITTGNGTDTFDAGSVNILVE